MEKTIAFFILLVILLPDSLSAKNLSELYSDKELQEANKRYSRNIPYLYSEDFLGRLTFKERFGYDVRLVTPLRNKSGKLFEFYSLVNKKIIVIPIQSIKFLDDLSIAFAYLEKNNCRKEMLFNYLTKLMYDKKYPPVSPKVAMGIPSNALNDSFVDDVSQKVLKSTFFFILGHEYGHIYFNHPDYKHISKKLSQQQEMQADKFSLNVMRRIGVVPAGLALFFSAVSRFEAVPSAFNTKSEYEKYMAEKSTHPLTGNRMSNIASYLKHHINDFTKLQANRLLWADLLSNIANDIDAIGKTVSDGNFRDFQFHYGMGTLESSIRNACR